MVHLTRAVPAVLAASLLAAAGGTAQTAVDPGKLRRIATVDERYQSYNIEMSELTGGQFWKPYDQIALQSDSSAGGAGQAQGAEFYAWLKSYLAPIDLSNPQLRKLARALGPAYVRSSGNAADAVYFQNSDAPAPATPPKGFEGVLTRQQWKGLVDFARAVDAKIVTSFAVSTGTRDSSGRWTPDQARRLIDYTRSVGGDIAAAEFFNEPTLGPQGIGGLPPGYDAAAFARDFAVFRPFAMSALPHMLVLGPSATGEGPITLLQGALIKTDDILTAQPRPEFDGFSYHAYSASSIRCKAPGKLTTTADAALTEEWLSRTERTYEYYAGLRDRYQPGTPIWVTETAESSCGGDPWAKTFLDTFRYLDQLGRLARHGVRSVMHNTLAVSDYALIDRRTMAPRPNYWAALLWRRLMGTTVLDSGVPIREGMHLYAQCLPGTRGGVTLLAINNSRDRSERLALPAAAERYTLTADSLQDEQVRLNGRPLPRRVPGEVPRLSGDRVAAGVVELTPVSITFFTLAQAANAACR